jgi:hypothetical protein
MAKTPTPRSVKNNTPPSELTIPLGSLKTAIEQEIEREIPRSTWSDWCRRTIGTDQNATQDRPIDLSQAATLWTIAGLSSYQARSYSSPVFKRLYPECLSRIKELFNV